MNELFEYLAEPLRGLIAEGDIRRGRRTIPGALAWIVPDIFFALFGWCMYALPCAVYRLGRC